MININRITTDLNQILHQDEKIPILLSLILLVIRPIFYFTILFPPIRSKTFQSLHRLQNIMTDFQLCRHGIRLASGSFFKDNIYYLKANLNFFHGRWPFNPNKLHQYNSYRWDQRNLLVRNRMNQILKLFQKAMPFFYNDGTIDLKNRSPSI